MKTAAATRPATSASGVSAAASASVPVRMTSSESTLADPGRVVQRGGMGPSQPGQACADKVFIFRITCVAEQCASPRYSETQECIQFKEMEQSRAEQRARSQGH